MINYSSPCAMPAGAFTKHWGMLTGNGRDAKAVFKIPEVSSGGWPAKMNAMAASLKSLYFAVIEGIPGESSSNIGSDDVQLNGKSLSCLVRVK